MERMQLDGNDINRVMDLFDFDKVHAYMVVTKWKWIKGNNEYYTPSVEALRVAAEAYLWAVVHSPNEVSVQGSGGFYAYRLPWGLKLTFEPFRSQNY